MQLPLGLIIKAISPFFRNLDIKGEIEKGQKAIAGTEDSLPGVQKTIQRLGITKSQINQVAGYVESNPLANKLCRMAHTTPYGLARQIRMLGEGNSNPAATAPVMDKPKTNQRRTFPKL